jgi:DNA-binding HxlR family transcriptional regulator
MALPRDYPTETCPIARSLEVVGERWTLLILRDAFYGVRRFTDFQAHLGIPKAVLSQRLALLVREGVLVTAAPVSGGRDEYILTAKGRGLWPVLRALAHWGADNYQKAQERLTFAHLQCGGPLNPQGVCARCGETPDPADVTMSPPRRARPRRNDAISKALLRPHRMLEPIQPAT